MTSIGLISDTHGYLDPRVKHHFKDCDEIWHAGDIGDFQVARDLAAFKPFKAVYGNIDGREARSHYPLDLRFTIENIDVWITHIGGYPGRYDARVKAILQVKPPQIFICGHSHILKVARDARYNNMLTLNPGAAGISGFHQYKTLLRFVLDNGSIKDLQAIELGKRGEIT
ncbi:MAG: metallophosphoesterase family protein [Chitinophagales bacterium]|nr:metallophosphoesterase family protein [Chitinophagales bacterium]